MQFSILTDFDPTLKCPGSQEISILGPPIAGVLVALPVPLRIAHSLTESSKSGIPCWLPRRSVSSRLVLATSLYLILQLEGFSGPVYVLSSTAGSVVRIPCDGRRGEGIIASSGW